MTFRKYILVKYFTSHSQPFSASEFIMEHFLPFFDMGQEEDSQAPN